MDLASILLMLAVILILARLASRAFTMLGVPGLIGEIILGIVLANLVIGDWSFLGMLGVESAEGGGFHGANYEVIELFAELGVILLLFSVGLETKVGDLMSVGKAAMLVAGLGVLVPFAFGFAATLMVDPSAGQTEAMFMAAAMVATSVGITARVIKDMKLIDTRESRIIIGAAVIDDVLGMIVLAIVLGMAQGGVSVTGIATITIEAVLFVLLVIATAKWVVPRIHEAIESRKEKNMMEAGKTPMGINKLAFALIICFIFAWFAETLGLAAIIGAFLGGMLLADYAWEWGLEHKIESISTLFLSFFFVHVGMQINISDCLNTFVLMFALLIIILAVISKYVGCSVGAKLGDKSLDRTSMSIIGVGMIPRGEVGIIVASYGLKIFGADFNELYIVIVVMAVATTIIAPPLLSKAFRKKYPPEYTITSDDL